MFKETLNKFIECGFPVNPDVKEAEIQKLYDFTITVYSDPVMAMYISLCSYVHKQPSRNISNIGWLFIEPYKITGAGYYLKILENLKRISKGELDFQNAYDYCNEMGDDQAWVVFTFRGNNHKWDFTVDDDWGNNWPFIKAQILCKEYNTKGRLTSFKWGEDYLISYLTEEEHHILKTKLGLHLEWVIDYEPY